MQANNPASNADAQPTTTPAFQRPSGSGGGNKKGTSAERRATHNAIERARRESLNGRFLQLAATLPSISDVRRPSKSLIVNKSLDFVADAMNREAIYRLKIDNMRQENMQLREQLNKFLTQSGLDPLPHPVTDELPVPLAEMRNKKRQSSLNASGPLVDAYDLEDDDGLFAAGSEGEGGKTSPTSSTSAASSVRGSLSSSMPTGIAGFTPISQNDNFGQQTNFLAAPSSSVGASGTSPGASSTSGDLGSRERSAGFEDAAGHWIHPQAFVPSSNGAAPAQHLTYAGLAFSSAGANNALMAQSSPPHSMGNSGVSAIPAVMAQNGPSNMFSMDTGNYMALRNAQHLQQHQQQQLQFQLQLQQHHQQQQQQQAANFVQYNQSSFFEPAPLQSANFLTAV